MHGNSGFWPCLLKPCSSVIEKFFHSVWWTVQELCKVILRECKKGCHFSYWFTGLESKKFSPSCPGTFENPQPFQVFRVKTSCNGICGCATESSCYSVLQSKATRRTGGSTENLLPAEQYFTAHCLFLDGVNPTVWTIGYAIPYHNDHFFKESRYGLGFNSMQGREAKHIKLEKYQDCSQKSAVVDSV